MKEALNGNSDEEAESVRTQIVGTGCKAQVFKADPRDSSEAEGLVPLINKSTPLHVLMNSAAIFESRTLEITSLEDGHKRFQINWTAPFLLSQNFAREAETDLRVVSICAKQKSFTSIVENTQFGITAMAQLLAYTQI